MKTWTKTRTQNLVRHKGGGYYARLFSNGQERWRSLKTKHEQVAKARLSDLLKDHRKNQATRKELKAGALLLESAAATFLKRTEENADLKPSSIAYIKEVVTAIVQTWSEPDVNRETRETDLRKVNEEDCRSWSTIFKAKYSATRFNSGISYLRKIIDIAVTEGIRHDNPAEKLTRKRIEQTKLELPTRAQFLQIVHEISHAGGRFSHDCANLVQFFAVTGCRKKEAANVLVEHVFLDRGFLRVTGDPEHGTKNRKSRDIPLIPEAEKLIRRMLSEREENSPNSPLLRVNEAQKALDRACAIVGAPRITHHDLRHLFATTCIEAGVDIPTVSRWLGHSDGGALAMRVYGHLRDEHSKTMAKLVSYSP